MMQDLAQLVMNSIGAIAGVALTFYFLMPLFKSQVEQAREQAREQAKAQVEQAKEQAEQSRALTKSVVQHELRAESRNVAMLEKMSNMEKQAEARNLALLEKMDSMQNQHIESFKSLRVELAESKKVAQDIYTFNLGRYKKGEAMGGVTE